MKKLLLSFLLVALAACSAPSAYAATLTVYPDPNPETTSVDADPCHEVGAGDTWANIVAGTGTTVFSGDSGSTLEAVRIDSHTVTDEWNLICRGIFLFDTSSLGATASISSATLSLYVNTLFDGLSITPGINIYSSAPASNTAVVAGDYDSLGTTEFSSTIAYGSLTNAAYNDFALNASGLAAISKTGISKLASRNPGADVADVAPTWSSGTVSRIRVASADATGTTQDPRLVVQYSVPSNAKLPQAIVIE